MKSGIKIMLLGVAFLLLGFYFGLLAGWAGFIALVVGCCLVLYGFFTEDKHDDRLEEVYDVLLKLRDNSAKTLTCKKCGEEYKEVYTSCPRCGYRENG